MAVSVKAALVAESAVLEAVAAAFAAKVASVGFLCFSLSVVT